MGLQGSIGGFFSGDHSWLVLSTDLGKMTVDDLDRGPVHAAKEEKTKFG